MNKRPSSRLQRLLWLAALSLFFAVGLFPVSNRLTRTGGLLLLLVVWFGGIGIFCRRRGLRYSLLGLTALAAGFLALPARSLPAAASLRSGYIAGLRRYDGVNYYWGGESPKGVDCSGLIRRGLVDSLFCSGLRTLNPGLVRRALSLWWHDCSASDLGEARDGLTIQIMVTPSINQLDHSKILPGDLAVTSGGAHVMAYLGDNHWIEADPGIGRVVTVSAPSRDNQWFQGQMTIVRWCILQP